MKITACLVVASLFGNVLPFELEKFELGKECETYDKECCSKPGKSCNYDLRVKEF